MSLLTAAIEDEHYHYKSSTPWHRLSWFEEASVVLQKWKEHTSPQKTFPFPSVCFSCGIHDAAIASTELLEAF